MQKGDPMPNDQTTEFDSFVRSHRDECYDEDGNFDWDEYQYLCDLAEYWDMDE